MTDQHTSDATTAWLESAFTKLERRNDPFRVEPDAEPPREPTTAEQFADHFESLMARRSRGEVL